MSHEPSTKNLVDTAHAALVETAMRLDWVGMSGIDVPLHLELGDGRSQVVAARLDAEVSLDDPRARGIHMSRLYLDAQAQLLRQPLSVLGLRHILRDFLASHAALSRQARLRLRFDVLLSRPALRSEHQGFKRYPIEILAIQRDAHVDIELGLKLLYSSTCPCSAALARQLGAEAFMQRFGDGPLQADVIADWLRSEAGMPATPHAQRSEAEVWVRLQSQELPIIDMVDAVEDALGTPVQTAVKREDEQAFALRNGQNLMFCEDAARRIAACLNPRHREYWVRVRHFESLHAHDAVAVTSQGVWSRE